ncbi:MAG: hypothetical protein U0520_04820 [Candidatus Saccharimonadales bacterium]
MTPSVVLMELMQLIGESATGISYYVDVNAGPEFKPNAGTFVNFKVL